VSDGDLLQRSMDATPEEWLDRLVTDRVMTEVRQEAAVAFRQPAIVAGFVDALAVLARWRRMATPALESSNRAFLPVADGSAVRSAHPSASSR
jgi:hypothetical protein